MIVWEEHGKILHPFGSQVIQERYGPGAPMTSAGHVLDTASLGAFKEWGDYNRSHEITPVISSWVSRNTLDPYLHQAVFHFLRAQNLKSADFETEAVVAFDCVMQSISGFVRSRCDLSIEPTRGQVCERLGLPAASAELAEYAYFIRNNFGAHAGGWRWWDQSELLSDEDLIGIGTLARTALSAAAELEPQVRSIEPFPSQWGHWFFENFEMLWDAVWFEKSAKWKTRSG
jgi:hypothetical protein